MYSHRPIFTILGEITDTYKIMNPQRFGSDPADVRIPVQINPEIRIQIPYHFYDTI